jgi:hypothetical protein
MWPGLFRMMATMGQRAAAGHKGNFTAVREWFAPRYATWKANPAAAVSLEEVAAYLDTDAPWVVAN